MKLTRLSCLFYQQIRVHKYNIINLIYNFQQMKSIEVFYEFDLSKRSKIKNLHKKREKEICDLL